MDNFRNAISDAGLFVLGFVGPKYTLKGSKYLDDHIRAWLDRGLLPSLSLNHSLIV